jgi:hypothetical protein
MTVGSPALIAYSLVLSSLNCRWVCRKAKTVKHKSSEDVTRVLIAIQQIPLKLTEDIDLLPSIENNEKWRKGINDRLNQNNVWSLATGSSVAWVVIAFGFTLIDSFASLDSPVDNISEGHAVGTLWLWLLCLVIGWMWVLTYSGEDLEALLDYVNAKARKRAAERLNAKAGKRPPGDSMPRREKRTAESVVDPDQLPDFLTKREITSLNRNQGRLTATFNYSRAMQYIVFANSIFRVMESPLWRKARWVFRGNV